ncbi:MAG: GxxExxY protein [bacterium]|nr:GxxExxY protein [bacterium]
MKPEYIKTGLIFKAESYAITGACFEVYKSMGCGFLEAVYQECLAIELGNRKIPYIAQKKLLLEYKGIPIRKSYEPDFVCYDRIILEIKAAQSLCDEDQAQVINYLQATNFQLGLLVNFGHYPKLEMKRILNTHYPFPVKTTT